MKAFIYDIFHGTMVIEKISQGHINEKSNFNDDIRVARRDYL